MVMLNVCLDDKFKNEVYVVLEKLNIILMEVV